MSRPIFKKKSDLIVSTGVTGCLKEIKPFLQKIAKSLHLGETAFVDGNFSDYPCRVIISYNDITRHSKNAREIGWNIFFVQEVA